MSVQNFTGKYRAQVVDNKDPQKRGRIRVKCPKVLGDAKSSWCEACVPVAYDKGGDFAIPKVGEFVWVEFEGGKVDFPIYTGSLWSKDKSPSPSYDVKTRLITWGSCKISMSADTMTLSVGGSKITIKADSIKINTPKLDLN